MGHEHAAQPPVDLKALPELTAAYHHARHFLAFLSGLLLMWDYLGLAFEGAPEGFLGLKVFILHASAISNAILLLAFYGALRLGIEWRQCDPDRRDTTASIVDCGVAYGLFVAAVSGYVLRRFQAEFSLLTIVGVIVGFLVAPVFILLFRLPQPRNKWVEGLRRPTTRLLWTILSASGVAALAATALGLAFGLPRSVTPGLPIGAALCGIAGAFLCRAIRRKLLARPPAA